MGLLGAVIATCDALSRMTEEAEVADLPLDQLAPVMSEQPTSTLPHATTAAALVAANGSLSNFPATAAASASASVSVANNATLAATAELVQAMVSNATISDVTTSIPALLNATAAAVVGAVAEALEAEGPAAVAALNASSLVPAVS